MLTDRESDDGRVRACSREITRDELSCNTRRDGSLAADSMARMTFAKARTKSCLFSSSSIVGALRAVGDRGDAGWCEANLDLSVFGQDCWKKLVGSVASADVIHSESRDIEPRFGTSSRHVIRSGRAREHAS